MVDYNFWNNLTDDEKDASLQSNWTHLNSGYKQPSVTVTYSFLTDADGRVYEPYVPSGQAVNFQAFNAYEQGFTRQLLNYLESFLNIDFVEVQNNEGRIGFGKHNMTPGGYADYPGISKQAVFVSNQSTSNKLGDFGLSTIVHELGHALGLSHVNEYTQGAAEKLDRDLDSSILTALSYNSGYLFSSARDGFFTHFGLLDIEALINIYGSAAAENNVFKLNLNGAASEVGGTWEVPIDIPFVLADSGGYDTVDASGLGSLNGLHGVTFNFSTGLFLNMGQKADVYDTMTKQWIVLDDAELIPHLSIHRLTTIEKYVGTAHDEIIIGSSNAETVLAGAGNDKFTGGLGNDFFDGGEGTDTGHFNGSSANFSITINKGSPVVVNDRGALNGIDGVMNVENLDFASGKDVNLDILDGVVNVTAADLTVFIEMYIAYFNRAPDAEGLFYWGTRLSEGMALQQIAKSFFVQPETVALYPDPNDSSGFVTAVYNNFLGRAPDQAGFNYWVNELDSDSISRDIFMLAIINGAKADTGSTADVDYITGKAKIGSYFSVIKGMSDTSNAKSAMALYDGSEASLQAAKNQVDSYYNAANVASGGELLINLVGVLDDPFAI